MKTNKLVGIGVLLLAAGRLMAQQRVPDKTVILTFDDGCVSHYTYVAPLLKKYGFDATFFVCEFPGYPDSTKYMSWKQIRQLSREGFEIGNHTGHHANISQLSPDSLREELAYVNRHCEEEGIPKPVNFAYPGYTTDSSKLGVFRSMGIRSARTGGERAYRPATDDPFYVPSFTPCDSLQKTINAIRQAKDGAVTVLTIHGVPDIAHPWVTTSPAVFEAILKYLKKHGYRVWSMRKLQEWMGQVKGSGS
ncbi:MAG: polysaccharide deacetylase family protein [Puia sp.]|nr:polysaccharide deacetylase family protein [Puia sp.]